MTTKNKKSQNPVSGDFVGRDKKVSAGKGGIAIGGNVSGSTIISGDHNMVNSSSSFAPLYQFIEEHPQLPPSDKEDLKAEVEELESEVQKGDQADESFLSRRLRNIQRIAPDVLDVALTTLGNPVAGLGMVAKKVVQKMADEVKQADK
jgi:hypothetical protein